MHVCVRDTLMYVIKYIDECWGTLEALLKFLARIPAKCNSKARVCPLELLTSVSPYRGWTKGPYWEFEQQGDNSCVLYVLLFTVLISIVNWHFVTPRWQACHSTVLMPLLSLICLLVNTRPAPDQGALFLVIGPSLSVCLCGSVCVRIHSPVNKLFVRPWKRPSPSRLISSLETRPWVATKTAIDPNIRAYADDIKNLTRINDTDCLTHLSPRETREGSIAQSLNSFWETLERAFENLTAW